MLRTTLHPTVYLALGVTDLRNNIDGLALIVQRRFKLDPFDKSLFVFCNRKKDKFKILYWDKNGFWLYYKRLEEGFFKWPDKDTGKSSIEVTNQQLSWLLDGLSIYQKNAFNEVLKRKII